MKSEYEARGPIALVESIGLNSVAYFDAENLLKLAVRYYPALDHADILVATKGNTEEKRDLIYRKYIDEIVPLYISDATLTLRFFEPDAPIFEQVREEAKDSQNTKNKSIVMV